MVVGVATIDLYLHGIRSLKEKRGVVRKVVDRVRNRFPVSAAEVDHLDLHQKTTIGLAIVTNDRRFADSTLSKALNFIEDLHLAEVIHAETEILNI